jgi:hypothetical protein
MSLRRFVLAAVLLGVLGGVLAALIVPARTRGTPAPPRITVLPPRHHKLSPGEIRLAPVKGAVAIELRVADPKGGPPFAIRVFRAVRRVPTIRGNHGRILGHDLCAQLGRVYRGRFGWIDALNRFRPIGFNYEDAPLQCGERWVDSRSEPVLTRTTLITDPLKNTAAPTESMVWGMGGSLLRSVAFNGAGIQGPPAKPSRRGAFVAFADLNGPSKVSATFAYSGRPAKTLSLDPARPSPVTPPLNRYEHGTVFGSERLEARAPDPTGGLAWGIMASRSTKGGYCAWDVGRVVGSRVGQVNYDLDTFRDAGILPCLQRVQLTRERPLAFGLAGFGAPGEELGADPQPGRIALRTLPGRVVIDGLARPDVREITIRTTRDVRTIVPSPRAHAFIVVYDGLFPSGEIVFTVTFTAGTHQTQKMPSLPPF